jgi:hypothetical protein
MSEEMNETPALPAEDPKSKAKRGPKVNFDPEMLKHAFVFSNLTLEPFAKKHGITHDQAKYQSKTHYWQEARRDFRLQVRRSALELLTEYEQLPGDALNAKTHRMSAVMLDVLALKVAEGDVSVSGLPGIMRAIREAYELARVTMGLPAQNPISIEATAEGFILKLRNVSGETNLTTGERHVDAG